MQFPIELLHTELERCGLLWVEIGPKEHQQYVQRWVGVYGDLAGRECRKRSGARAIAEAERMVNGSFLLIPCRDPSCKTWNAVGGAFRCDGNSLPDLTEVSHEVDVFICPEDFSWTLFYGHEVDVFGGPEFTTLEWMSPPVEPL